MSKAPTIKPLRDKIFLDIEKASLGALNTESLKTGVEWGTIIDIGPEVSKDIYKKGQKVFVKSWAVDCFLYEGKDYYFVSESSKGICAVVE